MASSRVPNFNYIRYSNYLHMKKLIIALLAFSFFSASAQTVDEVIQKYAANLGGLEAFNKIKTVKITGTYTTQGMDLPMTTQIINGKASRTEVTAMGNTVIRAYKDGKGWTQNPFTGINTPTEVTGTDLAEYKAQSNIASPLMDYKARGHQVELVGQETVEGIKTYKIKLTDKNDGKASFYYVNATDYSLVKTESEREFQGQTVNVETFLSNVKDFNGIKYSMTRLSKIDGQVFQSINYSSVEFNVPVDEKIFDMPK